MDNFNNIYTYINYYKNYTVKENPFNMMDALIYTYMTYIPLNNIQNGIGIKEFRDLITEDMLHGMAKDAYKMIKLIASSKRYKNIKIYNVIKEYTDDIEFGALTIRDKDYVFVGYQGSIGTMAGWKENFNITYEYPVKTQKRALEYFNKSTNILDLKIYVAGHSKGGNLAMSTVMELPKLSYDRVVKVYNFDGPGFRKEEFYSNKFKLLQKKLINIMPEGSLVGILQNNEKYNFVKSSGIGFHQHFPVNWHTYGEFFEPSKELDSSKKIQDNLLDSVNKISYDDLKKFVDTLFNLINDRGIKNLRDINKITIEDVKGIVKDKKNLSKDDRDRLVHITKILLNMK